MTTPSGPSQNDDKELRRERFYAYMARTEASLKRDPIAWASYVAERDAWLGALPHPPAKLASSGPSEPG